MYWKNDNWILLKDCNILYRGIALIRSDLPIKQIAAAEHKGRLIPYVRTQGWCKQHLSHFCDKDMITYFTSKVNTYLQPYLYDAGLFPVFISVTIGCLSEVRCKLYSLWIYKIKCCEQMWLTKSFLNNACWCKLHRTITPLSWPVNLFSDSFSSKEKPDKFSNTS